ncbi:MAG: hypothetical protein NTY23_02855 [Chloroflexi bacterium]|nr:hypothetical protein [Chloroflexota bacterium]
MKNIRALGLITLCGVAGVACLAGRAAQPEVNMPSPTAPPTAAPPTLLTASYTPAPIPDEFRENYTSLSREPSALDRYFGAAANPLPGATRFGAELLPANGNRGETLLDPRSPAGLRLYLDRLQILGVTGVTV